MWILLSIFVALGSFFGYHGTLGSGERVNAAATHSTRPDLPKLHLQSGSGPVGAVRA